MPKFFHYAWVFFILINLINAVILHFRFKKIAVEYPEQEKGYNQYLKGFLFFANVP